MIGHNDDRTARHPKYIIKALPAGSTPSQPLTKGWVRMNVGAGREQVFKECTRWKRRGTGSENRRAKQHHDSGSSKQSPPAWKELYCGFSSSILQVLHFFSLLTFPVPPPLSRLTSFSVFIARQRGCIGTVIEPVAGRSLVNGRGHSAAPDCSHK